MKTGAIIGAVCGVGIFYLIKFAYLQDKMEYVFAAMFALVFAVVGLTVWAAFKETSPDRRRRAKRKGAE